MEISKQYVIRNGIPRWVWQIMSKIDWQKNKIIIGNTRT